ncbi:MAG: DUF4159 domain-containing protein [bacterium]|nr:DUF4159 domain-containing protein [bacterium]
MSAFDFAPVRIQYEGGDWYNDRECLKILAEFVNENTSLKMDTLENVLRMSDKRIHDHPFLFITGHDKIKYSKKEIENLREYLRNGGFLYIDDDYGLNTSVRSFIKELFPEKNLVKLPAEEIIFSTVFKFDILPKIHEHYEGPPEAYGLYFGKKIGILYTYNTNFSDGWARFETYRDSDKKRNEALKMGANIIFYALFK